MFNLRYMEYMLFFNFFYFYFKHKEFLIFKNNIKIEKKSKNF